MKAQRRASVQLLQALGVGTGSDRVVPFEDDTGDDDVRSKSRVAWGVEGGRGPRQVDATAAEPPIFAGCARTWLGVTLFYANVFTDFAVLAMYRRTERGSTSAVGEVARIGIASAPRSWGNFVVAALVLQALAGAAAAWCRPNGSHAAALRGFFGLAALWEGCCCGAGQPGREGEAPRSGVVLARIKYAELLLENVPQAALQLHALFAFSRAWAGGGTTALGGSDQDRGIGGGDSGEWSDQGLLLLLSVACSIASGALTLASHAELFDAASFGAQAVEASPVLARGALAGFALLDGMVHALLLGALATAFRAATLGFLVLAMLARAAIFQRFEWRTPKEERWGGGHSGASVLCAGTFALPMSVMDVLVSERFGAAPLRTLMVWSFFETVAFAVFACAHTQHPMPAGFGCGCGVTEHDAVTDGLGYCAPPGSSLADRVSQPPSNFVLVIVLVVLSFFKAIAFFLLVMCSSHARKQYVFGGH